MSGVFDHESATSVGHNQTNVQPSVLLTDSSVTVQEHGLSLLHEPQKGPILADVIFVHGLQGHPRKTWQFPPRVDVSPKPAQNRGPSGIFGFWKTSEPEPEFGKPASVFWPKDLLPADQNDIRILTYGYDSHVSRFFKGPANKLNLSQHGEALLNRVDGERQRSNSAGRPIVFVAHSLGGLLVKEALVEAQKHEHDSSKLDVYNSTRAIIFFGTPHKAFDTNETILRTLEPDDERLDKLARDFQDILHSGKLRIGSLIESAGKTGLPVFNGKVCVIAYSHVLRC